MNIGLIITLSDETIKSYAKNDIILSVVIDNEQIPASGGSNVLVYNTTGNNTTQVTSTNLVGKTILLVFTNGLSRTEYSFNLSTGTLTFESVLDTDTVINVLYK